MVDHPPRWRRFPLWHATTPGGFAIYLLLIGLCAIEAVRADGMGWRIAWIVGLVGHSMRVGWDAACARGLPRKEVAAVPPTWAARQASDPSADRGRSDAG